MRFVRHAKALSGVAEVRKARFGRVVLGALLLGAGLAVVPILPEDPASATLSGMPPGFVDEVVVGGLPYPTAIAFTPDETMLIALKAGIVRVHRNGQLLPTPFINIASRVHDNHDRGLLSITVHPNFPLQPYVYLLYTHDPTGVYPDDIDPNNTGGESTPARTAQLMRVEADPATGYATAKPGTETVILGAGGTLANIGDENDGRNLSFATCMSPQTANGTPVRDCIASDEDSHTIGTVAFGPDGSLYVSSGDGSNYVNVDPRALRSQNLDSLNGKILRLDPITGQGLPDNPFFQAADPGSNRSKVWARGLRNPFRLAVDPADGDAYAGDVGWNNWEEINTGKGANFGWPCYEGGTADPGDNESGDTTSLQQFGYQSSASTSAACAALYNQGPSAVRAPVYAYNHTEGQGGATSGGAFYTGTTYPAQYRGAMFIADYNDRWIRYLKFDAQGRATKSNFGTDPSFGPVQLITGPDTNIYWMRYDDNGGEVRRIRYVGAGNTPPVAEVRATPTIGIAPLTVAFNSDLSYDPDSQNLSYAWNFGDGTTSTARNPSHTYTQAGVYDARLTLTELTSPFATATTMVRITVGSNPPLVTIEQPAEGSTYRAGDTISFSAKASAGGTPMPAGSMTWQLRNHHNAHVHFATLPSSPDPADPNRSRGSFVAEDHGDSVFYELCVTATVSAEITDNRCVNLNPQKVNYTLLTQPPGLQLAYEDEGIALSTPAIIQPVVGSVQTVSALPVQQHMSFVRWSDGSTNRSKTFTVGSTPQTFTAIYENKPPTAVITPPAPAAQAPLTVNFSGAGSSDPEGDVLTYEWSTSDGRTATGPTPSWTFTTPGTYTVSLKVTDELGVSHTSTVTVQATVNQLPPTASFTATPTSGRAPLTVALDGRASFDPEGGPLTYAWSSSDGQTATGPQTSLTFTQAGTVTVTLTVRDNGASTGTTSRTITVDPAGLVGAFGFDEVSGPSVLDRSGLGNNGTVSGATRSTTGRHGGALSFDGVNDSVSVPDAASLDLTNNMTLSAWVRPTGATGWRTVLMKERTGGQSYSLYSSSGVAAPSGWLVIGAAEQELLSPSALPANAWSHLAFTYDGSFTRLYVNGVEVINQPLTGSAVVGTGALKIGGNAIWGEWFAGLIDEVRLYNRALTPTQLQTDMANPINPTAPDTQVPSTPAGLTATAGIGQVSLGWTASTDNVGVTGYEVHRSTTAGFTPSGATLLTTVSGVSYVDTAVTAGTTYRYRVIARDAAGLVSTPSNEAFATPTSDTAAPSVSVSSPAAGATVSGVVSLAATAADNVGVVGVQFRVDGNNVGGEDTSSPFGTSWSSSSVANGTHSVTAVARDAAGNVTTSAPVSITVSNAAPDTVFPTVSVSSPAAGATVSGAVSLAATAADNVGVAGVQFRVDGTNVGTEDTSSPFGVSWSSSSVANGTHSVTAVARDAAGNVTTSAPVSITVSNAAPTGLVGAFGFDEVSGPSVLDRSGLGNNGTVSGATRSTTGRHGGALSFDGVNDSVSVPDAASLDLTNNMTLSAWVRPTGATGWRTVLMKERTGGQSYSLYSSSGVAAPSGWLVIGAAEQELLSPSALPANAWSHLAFTYDGSFTRLYVNGVEVINQPLTGSAVVGTGALKIGGNAIWGEWFAGLIDEVRLYNRALTPTQLQTDMANPINPTAPDTQVPSTPAGLTATAGIGQVSLGWTASTDNVGVTGYEVHRSTTAGFTPSGATLLTTVSGVSYVDTAVTAGTTYRYRVIARDAAGLVSTPSNEAFATPTSDTAAPSVSVSSPAAGATVSGVVSLAATAADNVGVVGVQFRVDGNNVGGEDTSSPFGTSWSSSSVANGTHSVTAVARDAAGNVTTSAPVSITVSNAAPDTVFPTVSVSSPAAGATVSGAVSLAATAADNVGVAGVQFRVDGTNVGTEDTSSPFGVSWSSSSVANGTHSVTAVARDAAGNVTTSAPVSITVSNAAPTGLVGAFGFDEVSGPSVLDRSGLGNNGTVSGATRSTTGRHGGALSFDGVNDSVSVPDAASLDLTNNMTLSAWVRPTGATGWRTVLMKERTGGQSYSLYSSSGVAAPSGWLVIGAAEQELLSPSALPANAWSHLAFTYDGSFTRLYVNGVEVINQPLTGSAVVGTGALKIGGNAIWGEWFAGLIDEVRLYNRALTPTQLQTDMANPINP